MMQLYFSNDMRSTDYKTSLRYLLFLGTVIFLFSPNESSAQDWRVSGGYSMKSYNINYTPNSLYQGKISSLRKGVLQLEVERYLLFRIYAAGQLDLLLQNKQDPLFGGSANFQHANLGAVVGFQWPKWGIYAGVGAGHLWDIRLRAITPDDNQTWLKPEGSAAAWTTSLKGGVKYYLLSFLRLEMEVSRVNGLPVELSPRNTVSGTPEFNSFSFNPYTFNVGISLSLPWNSKKYNRSKRPARELPELKHVSEVNFASPMPAGATLTSPFGQRWTRNHDGVDLDAERGDPIMAAADGIVVIAGKGTGYGKMIKIRHGAGYSTVYAHLSRVKVKYGQRVRSGDIIGKAGTTGTASGPHLHFEILHNGQHLNPQHYIRF